MDAGMMDENAGLSTMPDTTKPSEMVGLYAAAWQMPCCSPSGAPRQQSTQCWQHPSNSQQQAQQWQAINLAVLGAAAAADPLLQKV